MVRNWISLLALPCALLVVGCKAESGNNNNGKHDLKMVNNGNDLADETVDMKKGKSDLAQQGDEDLATVSDQDLAGTTDEDMTGVAGDDLAGADQAGTSVDQAGADQAGAGTNDLAGQDAGNVGNLYHVVVDAHDPIDLEITGINGDAPETTFCILDASDKPVGLLPFTFTLPAGWAIDSVTDESDCSYLNAASCKTGAAAGDHEGCFGFHLRAGYKPGNFTVTIGGTSITSATIDVSAHYPTLDTKVLALANASLTLDDTDSSIADATPLTSGPLPKPATTASLQSSGDVAADDKGGYYVLDFVQAMIFHVDANGVMTAAIDAGFLAAPNSIAFDTVNQRLYVLDLGNSTYLAEVFYVVPGDTAAIAFLGTGDLTADGEDSFDTDISKARTIHAAAGKFYFDDGDRIRVVANPEHADGSRPVTTVLAAGTPDCTDPIAFVGCGEDFSTSCAFTHDAAGNLILVGKMCGDDIGVDSAGNAVNAIVEFDGLDLTWLAGTGNTANTCSDDILDFEIQQPYGLVAAGTGVDRVLAFGDFGAKRVCTYDDANGSLGLMGMSDGGTFYGDTADNTFVAPFGLSQLSSGPLLIANHDGAFDAYDVLTIWFNP